MDHNMELYVTQIENRKTELTWTIENFSLCPQKNGEILESKVVIFKKIF